MCKHVKRPLRKVRTSTFLKWCLCDVTETLWAYIKYSETYQDEDMPEVWIVPMNVSLCQWKWRRNIIKSDFPSSTLSITSSYMLFFLPISTTCIHMSNMSSQSWSSLTDLKASPRGLNTWWFIHVQTHNLLKHTQSVSPLEDLKDVALHWSSLACSYASLCEEFNLGAQLASSIKHFEHRHYGEYARSRSLNSQLHHVLYTAP